MAGNRKSQLIAAAIVLALIVSTFLLILSLNLLAWPLGSEVAAAPSKILVQTQTVQQGELLVKTQGLRTVISSPTLGGPANPQNLSTISPPLSGISLSVTRQGSFSPLLTAQTDSSGEFKIYLPPASYAITINDNRFKNLTAEVTVSGGKTTHFEVFLNETDYPSQSINEIDSDSSNWVGGWNQLYALVPSNGTIPSGTNVVTYAEFGNSSSNSNNGSCSRDQVPNACPVLSINQFGLVPALVLGTSLSSTSQWIQLSINSFVKIDGISSLTLVTFKNSYSVIESGP